VVWTDEWNADILGRLPVCKLVLGVLLDESIRFNKKALRALQDREAQGQAVRDLQQPQAQAAPRIGE
jgi:hypothetical protein